MIRKFMASSAVLALMTAGLTVAQAQTEPADTQQPPAATEDATQAGDAATTDMAAGEADATLTPEQPTIATAYIGRSVYSSEDPESDNIGEVNDLIIGDARAEGLEARVRQIFVAGPAIRVELALLANGEMLEAEVPHGSPAGELIAPDKLVTLTMTKIRAFPDAVAA